MAAPQVITVPATFPLGMSYDFALGNLVSGPTGTYYDGAYYNNSTPWRAGYAGWDVSVYAVYDPLNNIFTRLNDSAMGGDFLRFGATDYGMMPLFSKLLFDPRYPLSVKFKLRMIQQYSPGGEYNYYNLYAMIPYAGEGNYVGLQGESIDQLDLYLYMGSQIGIYNLNDGQVYEIEYKLSATGYEELWLDGVYVGGGASWSGMVFPYNLYILPFKGGIAFDVNIIEITGEILAGGCGMFNWEEGALENCALEVAGDYQGDPTKTSIKGLRATGSDVNWTIHNPYGNIQYVTGGSVGAPTDIIFTDTFPVYRPEEGRRYKELIYAVRNYNNNLTISLRKASDDSVIYAQVIGMGVMITEFGGALSASGNVEADWYAVDISAITEPIYLYVEGTQTSSQHSATISGLLFSFQDDASSPPLFPMQNPEVYITPVGGSYLVAQSALLTTNSDFNTILYTTDNSNPLDYLLIGEDGKVQMGEDGLPLGIGV